MWLFIEAEAKPGVSLKAVNERRNAWLRDKGDRILAKQCRSFSRYSVVGSSPMKVLWLLETDNEAAVNHIANHFGDLWNIKTHLVLLQSISEALKSS